MRIGFDSKRLFCNNTGLGNYSRTIVKNLVNQFPNHSYFLYSTSAKENNKTSFFFNHKLIKILIPKTSLKILWRSFFIVKQLKKDNITIFHGLSNEIPFFIKKSSIKSIVTIHDLIFKHYPNTYPFFDRLIYNLKFKYSCKNADKIIAISDSTKNDIINFYGINPNKIEVVYQSCNPLFYNLQKEDEVLQTIKKHNLPQNFFLFVGSVEERKNLKLIIECYQYLPKELKLPLVIVGKPREKSPLIALIEKHGVTDLIIWKSNLEDDKELQAFYQYCKILIYPSLFEGFGLPVVEGLLSKTPVITSTTSSLPEAGGPSTYFVNPFKPKEMADAIFDILSNEELRIKMIENGYKYALDNFSEKIVSEKMMKIYNSLINS